jgi:hypothetical protein
VLVSCLLCCLIVVFDPYAPLFLLFCLLSLSCSNAQKVCVWCSLVCFIVVSVNSLTCFLISIQVWAKANKDHAYTFQTLCESRWYSMVKVCLSIKYYEPFLKDAKEKHGSSDKYPKLKEYLPPLISNNLFRNTEDILQVLKPLGDCIGHLEKAKTNLADIYLQMIELQTHYRKVESKYAEHALVKDAIRVLSKRFKQYFSDIFVLVLFFWPRYRDFVSSRFYDMIKVKKMILQLLTKWGFTVPTARDVMNDVVRYSEWDLSEDDVRRNPTSFWQTATTFQRPLRSFVTTIYKLKGHAAPVESLFSKLSYAKPKIRNKMTTDHMKMMGIIEDGLKKDKDITPKHRKRKALTNGCVAVNDSLTDAEEEEEPESDTTATLDVEETTMPDFVAEFEALLIEDDEAVAEDGMESVQETQVNVTFSYIDTIFDLTKLPLRHVNTTMTAATAATGAAAHCALLTADMFEEFLT